MTEPDITIPKNQSQETEEIWKPIPGYEGYYSVSNLGRVRRDIRRGRRVNHVLRFSYAGKYQAVDLWVNRKVRHFTVHSLVAAAFIGERPSSMVINHKDGKKENNHSTNLEYCTREENTAHAVSTGLTAKGERNPKAKLTRKDIVNIRDEYNTGGSSYRILANKYHVARATIYKIVKHINWD